MALGGRADPVSAPPCMVGGRVYTRLAGQTVPVRDQYVMAELVERGRGARRRARDGARALARGTADALAVHEGRCERLSIALAPVGVWSYWATKIFARSFTRRVEDAILEWSGRHEIEVRGAVAVEHLADGAAYTFTSHHLGSAAFSYGLTCTEESGVVAVWWEELGGLGHTLDSIGDHSRLQAPWRAATRILRDTSASAPLYVAADFRATNEPGSTLMTSLPAPVELDLRTLEDPSEEVVGRLHRKLRRATGHQAFEPEG